MAVNNISFLTACSESGVNISARHEPSAGAAHLRCSPRTDSGQYADECQSPVRSYVTSAVLAQNQSTSGRSKEIIVHTGEGLHVHQRHQELLRTSSSHAGHSGKAIVYKLYRWKKQEWSPNHKADHTRTYTSIGEIHTNCLFCPWPIPQWSTRGQ